jgi:hypothetical protein
MQNSIKGNFFQNAKVKLNFWKGTIYEPEIKSFLLSEMIEIIKIVLT